MSVTELLEALSRLPPEWVWVCLFFGALIEYVFPPFPGDTVVVAGAALVGSLHWPIAPVVLSCTAGTVGGAALDWALGRWLAAGDRVERFVPASLRPTLDEAVEAFGRRGLGLLLLNRFVPGVRAFFFVAAGMAGMPLPRVLLAASISAVAWNGALVGLGIAAGRNVEALAAFVARYNAIAGASVGLGLAALAVYLWRRARSSHGGRGSRDRRA
ncbi:MAG: DedA family protein [Myxococcales bacterium]|nr:DedA family protein [Myxococcales bacterium]